MNTRHGAFIKGVDQFDAEFFGVSPREAVSMDPQHRLLMETSWEALENAAIAPAALRGSPTGVFVGIGNSDYWRMVYGDEEQIDAYSALGNSYSVAAGRLSYFLGVHGPSMAVDTACSASLVAVHLACRSLRSGECTLALAAGVNLILSPEANINFSKSRMLAPDGRCKTFDASADGYVRGEGCGVVVLKTLSAAQADGNRILAVIRGSAVNQDGRSGGLTAPNGPAQEAVIRAALAAAGVDPHEVSYLEAHGTGTSLGDPIEVRAASAVLCKDRPHESPAGDRFHQDQHRPPGGGGRCGRVAEGGARTSKKADSAAPSSEEKEPIHRLGRPADCRSHQPDALGTGEWQTHCRREFVRL